MILNNIKLDDPLQEPALPKWAVTLKQTHHSPSQGAIPDGFHLHKYCVLSQEERRNLKGNAQMKAGVVVNNIIQKHFADTIYKISPLTKKLAASKNNHKGKDRKELTYEEVNELKNYIPVDEKDQQKKEKYEEEVFDVVNNAFSALEKIGVTGSYPITCEEQLSITQDVSSLSLPVVGRTDLAFTNTDVSLPFPSGIVELKTGWSKAGKLKVNGERSFISLSAPVTPSFNHITQCATYAAFYDYKVPVYLVHANKKEFKIYDSNNCPHLTVEGLKQHFKLLCNIFRRREKIYSQFENLPKEELIKSAAELIDPMFSHPYCWHNYDYLDDAKRLWNAL